MGTKSLRRYTSLASLVHILFERKLTLLDPSGWDDRNDRYFMEMYKKKKGLQTLVALCLCEENETFHHWKVFSSGGEGVCIEFNSDALSDAASQVMGMQICPVNYVQIKDARKFPPDLDQLPFTKRYPYNAEKEIRLIYASEKEKCSTFDLPIELAAIQRITLSPWLPVPLRNSVKKAIKQIDGCADLKVYRSTLLENEQWKKVVQEL
ncbi:DUF2971 domain-containing protein [Thalassospira profundimaris]|uniref:DUF2971 domain-containing protein n=1 Tax=Thalassospira profundimaris TaxID=502049 RepID=UPI0002872D2A|nr:DUF2971 domain-containing protein [Thalassospira profundimaris]EKF07954.1 hypothetical protein TH2_10639 [Thalassospira profundimaris WP0211]